MANDPHQFVCGNCKRSGPADRGKRLECRDDRNKLIYNGDELVIRRPLVLPDWNCQNWKPSSKGKTDA